MESSPDTLGNLLTIKEADQNDKRFEDQMMCQKAQTETKTHWNASADDAQCRGTRQCQCTSCEHFLEDIICDERRTHDSNEIVRIAQSPPPSTSVPAKTSETSVISAAGSDNHSVLVSANRSLHDPHGSLELSLKENDV